MCWKPSTRLRGAPPTRLNLQGATVTKAPANFLTPAGTGARPAVCPAPPMRSLRRTLRSRLRVWPRHPKRPSTVPPSFRQGLHIISRSSGQRQMPEIVPGRGHAVVVDHPADARCTRVADRQVPRIIGIRPLPCSLLQIDFDLSHVEQASPIGRRPRPQLCWRAPPPAHICFRLGRD